MQNAKDSAMRRYNPKRGKNRDGNEKVRKGLGGTDRSIRMDRYSCYGPRVGNRATAPGAVKIARQEPIFPMFEDGCPSVEAVDCWNFRRFFDGRNGVAYEAQEYLSGRRDADDYEEQRYEEERAEFPTSLHEWARIDRFNSDATIYSVQSDAYGDWSTILGRISLSDASRVANQTREWAWYTVRIVNDRTGDVIDESVPVSVAVAA